MQWCEEKFWVKGTSHQEIIEGCKLLYGGTFTRGNQNDVIDFKNELLRRGVAVREIGNGPRMHDGLVIRKAWVFADKTVFCLLKVDAREWMRQQETRAKELNNLPALS